MNKKISLGLAISLIAIASAVTFILTTTFSLDLFNSTVKNVKERAEIYNKLDELDSYVRNNYNGTIDEDRLLDAIASGYVSGIDDKYARYYSVKDFQAEKLADAGATVGIGITVRKDESNYIKIVEVKENSPAAENNLMVGGVIVAVDDKDVLSTGYAAAVNAISGEEGTVLKLTIRRDGVDTQYQLARRRMEIISVTGEMLENNIGYIKITEFNSITPDQFIAKVDELINGGAKEIIFGVRDNGGGLLTSVSDVLNYLLPAGDIATATYKDGSTKVIVQTTGEHEVNLPMVVLVNGNTASSAELFAAALRDSGKAQLVGTTTYGKGVMQKTFPCLDGSAVTMTIATYETAKTPCYDGIGLKPNFEVAATSEEDILFTGDKQLTKAIEVVKTIDKE